jgi:hypothetical protein
MVLPLRHLDIRAEDANGKLGVKAVARIKMGATKVTSSRALAPIFEDKVDAPFRDEAHAKWDGEVLNLPVYAVCDETSTKLSK